MQTLVDLLKESAERYGDSTALAITPGFRQQRWSYERLWDLSGRVAAFLAQRGLEKGDRAIIWSVNRPEWVAAFFGCMRAGVVAVPLDVRTAPDFVERVVEYTTPKLAFLSRQTPDGPPERRRARGPARRPGRCSSSPLTPAPALPKSPPTTWRR